MTDREPTVTIGLPVYNAEQYLDAAMRSLLAQDHTDLELIVADNASTDRTADICRDFAARDPRVRFLSSETNRGLAWNHNRVVHAARGRFFKWAAYDDLYDPTFVSRCLEVLEAQPEVVLAHTGTVDIDADGNQIAEWPPTDRATQARPGDRFADVVLNERECFPIYGLMRTEVLRSTALMGAFPSSDEPLLAELALRGPFAQIPQPLFLHREHPGRSMALYPSARARQAFYNPGRRRVSFPLWREMLEFFLVLRRGPVIRRDRLRGAVAVLTRARRQWRWLARDLLGGLYWLLRAVSQPLRRPAS